MRKQALKVGLVAAVMVLAGSHRAAAESMDAEKAFGKLARGAVNLLTGWVEIPKRVHETSQQEGAIAGFTWGLVRGLGYGFIRTAAGAYELVTFPFPAPPAYAPVIRPEYVFTTEDVDPVGAK